MPYIMLFKKNNFISSHRIRDFFPKIRIVEKNLKNTKVLDMYICIYVGVLNEILRESEYFSFFN